MLSRNKKILMLALIALLPMFSFASGTSDAFVVPFQTLLKNWMTGNVGLTIAIIIMIISVVWGAFGGGFGVIGKGFILSILVGGVVYFAEKAFDLGSAFAMNATPVVNSALA